MNKQLKLVLSFFLFTLIFLNYSSGQSLGKTAELLPKSGANERCKTDQRHQHLMQTDAQYQAAREQVEQHFQDVINHPNMQRSAATVYTIPVVVHIMHLGEGVGTGTNISDAQIQSAISNLTDAYGSSNTGTDTDIEFCLAVRDPSGNATTGINRIDASGHSSGGDSYATKGITDNNEAGVKALSKWDNTKYYNMWIVSEIENNGGGSGTQGYAYFPGASATYDGAVIMYNAFGYDPTGSNGYNLKSYTRHNATTVHEMGHGLNLYHTFQGDDANSDGTPDQCPSNASCGSSSDCCADTDPHRRDDGDCGSSGTTCFGAGTNLADIVTNIMAYSSDVCQTKFSADQTVRMRAVMTGSRSSLTTSDGCSPAAPPVSDFYASGTSACTGVSVDFFDNSQNGTSSWAWTFESGTPSSSTSQNPSASWASGGTFDVSLTASNTQGAGNTETKVDYITVYTAGPSYCTMTTTNQGSGYDLGVERVQFNTIDNAHDDGTNQNTQDFTCSYVTELDVSTGYSLTVTAGDNNGTETGSRCRVYIDYDGDGLYEAGEIVYDETSLLTTHSTTVNTPAVVQYDQVLGMRVLTAYNSITNPCASDYGEAEDYGVYFAAPAVPPVTDFVADITSGCEGSTVNFTDNTTNAPTSWSWIFESNGTSTSQNPSKVYNTSGVYDVSLTATNAYGNDAEVKTDYITIYGSPSSYCTVSTVNTGNFSTGINRVQFNTIDNAHTGNNNDGTQDFTCSQITELDLNTGYGLTVTLDGGNLEYCKVYIDYNGNGTYESSEVVYASGGKAITHSTTITTPASCTYDKVLGMRVISDFNPIGTDPCANVSYGEVEDYGVYFAAPPCSTATIDTDPVDESICEVGNTSFSVTATNALTYQWQEGYEGAGFVDISDDAIYGGTSTPTLSLTGLTTADFDASQYRCIITGNCNNDTSAIATVTVNPQPFVTLDPSNSSITENTGTSFSVTADNATGYQWQRSTGGSYTNISNGGVFSGATSATLTLSNVPLSMNGNTFRCVVTNSCGSVNSGVATLTVTAGCTPPSITTNPSNSSICESSSTSFSIAATNASSYQWQLSTGGSFTNISNGGVYSGATSSTLDLTGVTSGLSGNTYRCIAIGGCSPNDTSTAATLTVTSTVTPTAAVSLATGTNPACDGDALAFHTAITNGGVSPRYIYYVNGSIVQNAINGHHYNVSTLNNGDQVQSALVSSATCVSADTVWSSIITMTINVPPSVNSSPSNSTITENNNTSFSVTASNATGYQWQENAGGSFTNITNGGVYGGATSSTLTLTSVPVSMNGNSYRCVVTGNCSPDATSDSASLTVNAAASTTFTKYVSDAKYGKQLLWVATPPVTSNNVYVVPQKISGGTSYTVQISTDPDFLSGVLSKTGTVSADWYFTGLTIGVRYYTRTNVNGGAYGNVQPFDVESIGTSALGKVYDQTYGWQEGNTNPTTAGTIGCRATPVTGATLYTVEVNTDPGFGAGTAITKSGADWSNIGSFTFAGLTANATYYVRVMTDNEGYWGVTRTFNVEASGTGTSVMGKTYDLTYGWQSGVGNPTTATNVYCRPTPVTGATEYTVEVNTDPGFGAGTAETKVGLSWSSIGYYYFDSLNTNTTYYVRVMTDIEGYWGATRTFTTDGVVARPMVSADQIGEEVRTIEEAFAENSYLAYPNPFGDVINLRVDSEETEQLAITVTDLTGKVVYASTGFSTNNTITFGSELEKGMYMVQLQHGDHLKLMKVIKQ